MATKSISDSETRRVLHISNISSYVKENINEYQIEDIYIYIFLIYIL